AALRELELAQLARVGARERAPLVAEQLRLDERLDDRRRVDGDEGLVAARPLPVDRARDELLARPALPRDEHRRRRARDLGDHPERFPDTRIVVNDQDHRPRHRGWTLPLGPGACRRTANPVELSPSFPADPGAAGCCATISRKVVSLTAPLRK